MKRPLKRTTPLKSSSTLKRTGRLAQQSPKRIAERDDRRAVVASAIAAEGNRCGLWFLGDCYGELVGHEVVHRSVLSGSHMIRELVAALCVGHNNAESDWTNELAVERGVRAPAWAVDQYGAEAVGAECRRIRFALGRGQDPGLPFWT